MILVLLLEVWMFSTKLNVHNIAERLNITNLQTFSLSYHFRLKFSFIFVLLTTLSGGII